MHLPSASLHSLMALYARRKLIHSHCESEDTAETAGLFSLVHDHCHSLGRTLSNLQHPQHKLPVQHSTDCQPHSSKRCQELSRRSPFATISFCAASNSHSRPGKPADAGPGMPHLDTASVSNPGLLVLQRIIKTGVTERRTSCWHQLMRGR